ncbi:MAG: hypothetical protein ACYDCO_25210 [Armatimonadota bacterium]
MPQPPEKQDELVHARLRRLLWLLPALLLLTGGFLYWRHLQQFRVVLAFDDANIILEPRTTGFLIAGDQTPYSFYDWRGTLRWQVGETHRGRYIRTGAVLMETTKRHALSPDGQFLTSIENIPWAKQVELRTWRNGKPYRKMKVPLGMTDCLQQSNDGSVYIAGKRQGETSTLLWINGSRVAAKADSYPILDIAPDGGAAILATRMFYNPDQGVPYSMAIVNKEIRLRPLVYRGDSTVHDKGIILFSDGFRQVNGVIKPLVPGAPKVHLAGLSRTRGYALFDGPKRAVVISPVTGARWSFPLENGVTIKEGLPGIAENGRFAAVVIERDAYRQLRRLYAAFPPLAQRLPRRQRQDVLLYARPGRLVTNLSEALDQEVVTASPWYPSPDGRALLGFIRENNTRRCVLIRRR